MGKVGQKSVKILLTIAKTSLALGLVAWMVTTGRLDFAELGVYQLQPRLLFYSIMAWGLGSLLLGAWRWNLLLRGLNISISYLETVRLHLIGLFFNTAMPGAVGGDVIKALYILKSQGQGGRRTPALLSIVLDRLIGLLSLFSIGAGAVLSQPQFFWHTPRLVPIAIMILSVFIPMVGIAALACLPFEKGDPIDAILKRPIPGFLFLQKIYGAFRSYRNQPWTLLGAWAVSVITQMMLIACFWQLAIGISGEKISLSGLLGIFPIGMISVALPLAPGGLGVGHAAFQQLFALMSVKSGANIFNAFFLAQMGLNLLGLFPYLGVRSSLKSNGTGDVHASESAIKL